MELHRRHPNHFLVFFFLLGGIVTIWAPQNGWQLRFLVVSVGSAPLFTAGLIMTLGALASLASTFRPAPIALSQSALRLRAGGINGSVPWTSIDALLLEPHQGTLDSSGAPRLLLFPSADANLGTAAEYQTRSMAATRSSCCRWTRSGSHRGRLFGCLLRMQHSGSSTEARTPQWRRNLPVARSDPGDNQGSPDLGYAGHLSLLTVSAHVPVSLEGSAHLDSGR